MKKKLKKKLWFIVFHDFDGVRILCHSFVSEFHWSIFEFEYSHKVTEEVFCFDQWRCINLILSSSECSLAETIWFFFFLFIGYSSKKFRNFVKFSLGKWRDPVRDWRQFFRYVFFTHSYLCILRFYCRMGYRISCFYILSWL